MADPLGRLIAIGDIHGCIHALEAVLEAIQPVETDHLIVLGDFIDQGRDTRDVIARLIQLQTLCRLDVIEGNHEEMLLAARHSEPALRYWENCGGVPMLNSYRFGGTLADIPTEHWQFIERCLPYFETDEFIFAHANVDPRLPMAEQSDHTLRWELFDPAEASAHCSGKTVFVGHTEQRSGEVLELGFIKCIDTACWRSGWLTALEARTGQIWQASRWGLLREQGEPVQIGRLPMGRA